MGSVEKPRKITLQRYVTAASGTPDFAILLDRVVTFAAWPHHDKLSSIVFASAGFYYAGRGDEVTCYVCGLTLSKWTTAMQPLHVHRELGRTHCDFVDRLSRLGRWRPGTEQTSAPGDYEQPQAVSLVSKSSAVACGPAPDACPDWLTSAVTDGMDEPCIQTLSSLGMSVMALLRASQGRHDPQMVGSNNGNLREPPDEELLKLEAHRLSTFMTTWQYASIVKPQELARAGFHHIGPGDRVQCAFCQGLLRNWEHGDRAMDQHAQHFTYCRFVQGHDVGNVPIPFWPLVLKLSTDPGATPSGLSEATLGISYTVPKHPDFAVEVRRQATFATWPSAHHLNPETLAKAGYFFLGSQDAVKCFYCDSTVTDWQHGSDPWVEHAKRSPSCPFLEQVKGRDFVQLHSSGSAGSDVSATQRTSFAVDAREVRARMDTPKVRVVLQMEYPLDLVREVIQKRLGTVGHDHETSEDLLADVFTVHDEKQRAAVTVNGVQPRTSQLQSGMAAALPFIVAGPKPAAAAGIGERSTRTHASSEEGPVLANAAAEAVAEQLATMVITRQPTVEPPTARPDPEEENRQLKTQLVCKICMDSLVGIVFLPCGHFVCCAACAPALTTCPICRVTIRGTVRTIL